MALDAKKFYDVYWARRDRARAEARSRERARATLELLASAGVHGGRLLDVGCGPGWALEAFKAAGFQVLGVDASSVAVEEARARGLDARVLELDARPEKSSFEQGVRFDAIVALEVLEHLVDPLAVIEGLRGLLAPHGRIVASLPNEVAIPARLRVLAGRLPFGGHDDPHVRHFDRLQARRLFDTARLRVVAERSISIVPPRWQLLTTLMRPALSLFPNAFAIATVYLLSGDEPEAAKESHEG